VNALSTPIGEIVCARRPFKVRAKQVAPMRLDPPDKAVDALAGLLWHVDGHALT